MGTKLSLSAIVLLVASSICVAQGLTDPNRFYSPRLGDPGRLSFSGPNALNAFNGGVRFASNREPALIGLFPDRFFNSIGSRNNNAAIGPGNFGRGHHHDLNDFLLFDPEMARTFGYNAYASATGVGNRAAGIGTGVGNKFAGLGAYYYGQGAGLGMFASGMGDYLAGQGRLLEGQGNYEQSNSVANINNEEAEYRDMKNDEYNVSAFFNKRRANIEARRYENDIRRYTVDRLSTEQLAKLQEQRAPDRLGFQQYDEVTGALAWPALLRNPAFAASRQRVNELFAKRVELGANTGLGSENYRHIRRVTQQLEEDLRSVMPDLAPMEYTMAKNFLRSLEYEAQQPMATSFPVARIADAR
jgi:hypothetical protein